MKERSNSLDALKFVLVVLVCLGHLMHNDAFVMNQWEEALYRLLYSFHVSTFAFLSGYLTSTTKSYFKSFIYLYETVVVGNIVWAIINSYSISWDIFYFSQYHLWYLMGLIFWRGLIVICRKYVSINLLLCISILFYFLIAKLEIWYFGFYLVFTYFPFFLLGYKMKNCSWIEEKGETKNYSGIKWIAPFLLIYVIYLLVPNIGSAAHNNGNNGFMWLLADRFSFIIISPILVVSCIKLNNYIHWPMFFAKLGKDSLIYYIYHGFLRTVIVLFFIKNSISMNFIEVLLFLLLIFLFIYLLSFNKFSYYLLNPISSLIKALRKNSKD